MQQQPRYIQTNMNFGGGGGGGAAMQNPYCIFANNKYCHSCGTHVHDGHNIVTCKMPGPNQNHNATLANPLGGSRSGAHKNVMPEQCGRTADRRP